MGTSGLVAVLQPGELRPADEHSLWGVVNDLSDLAEAEPPANESALAKRKRLLASKSVDTALGRLETNQAAVAAGEKARAAAAAAAAARTPKKKKKTPSRGEADEMDDDDFFGDVGDDLGEEDNDGNNGV